MTTIGRDWFGLVDFDPGEDRKRAGGFLYLLDTVGSTSDFLLGRGESARGRLCRWDGWGWQAGERQDLQPPAQARGGSMAVAREQCAGRGRMGRRWFGGGGLQMSWILDTGSAPVSPGLSVWTGLICAIALRELTGEAVGLKWPNDLRLRGRKLGGLLLDRVQRKSESRIVAGLGLNIGPLPAQLPDEVRAAAISLKPESWPGHALSMPAGAIIGTVDNWLPAFLQDGWGGFFGQFAELDEIHGRRIRLSCAGGDLEGIAEGIDSQGALKLRTASGMIETIIAGDVHILGIGEGEDAGRRHR